MNIYHISWVQGGGYGLNAVIIAHNKVDALTELDLDMSNNDEIKIHLIGVCTDGTTKSTVICRECL